VQQSCAALLGLHRSYWQATGTAPVEHITDGNTYVQATPFSLRCDVIGGNGGRVFTFHRRRRIVAGGISILVTCGVVSLISAQTPAPRLHLLQTVLQAAFPELEQVDNRISIIVDAAFASDWTASGIYHFRLLPSGFKPPTETVESQDDQFLTGHAMIAGGYVEHLTLQGLHVRSRENATLRKRAEDHPSWSGAELQKAIDDVGGLYGPHRKEAFTREVSIDRFREAFGDIQHSEVTFFWRVGRPDLGSADVIGVVWRVALQTIEFGLRRCPVLLFEPLGGKLTGLVEGPCGP
jgi:hypothetical protein